MNIKVKCKACDWEGQAVVGKRGYPLNIYKCPECGQNIERGKGRYDYYSESAKLKRIFKNFKREVKRMRRRSENTIKNIS